MTESPASPAVIPANFDEFSPLEKLTFIATGNKEYPLGKDGGPPRNPPEISVEQYKAHKSRIDELVRSLRAKYTNPDRHGDSVRNYYAPCWEMFDEAENEQEVAEALDYLISSLRWE